MKTFLFHIDPNEKLKEHTDTVYALAEKYGAHVIASHITPLPATYIPYSSSYMVPVEISLPLVEEFKAAGQRARQEFGTQWGSAGPTWEWLEENGTAHTILAEQARAADLTIVGLGIPDLAGSTTLAANITIGNGLPVLALPANALPPLGTKPVIIGWDGSLEATHAIRHALPFLKSAPEVIVAEIGEDKPQDLPSADIAPYLVRHGLKVEAIRQTAAGSIAEELLTVAHAHGAELIVTGAYGHARLREYVFGGVTRHILHDATIPIFLCH